MNKVRQVFLLLLFQSLFFGVGISQDRAANADVQEAEILNRQSGRLYTLRQFDAALEIALKELALREKVGDEQFIAAVRFNVGGIYREKGDLEQAIKYFESSLIHYRKAFGNDHIKVFNGLNQLARVLVLKDEKTKALKILQDAQPLAENIYGGESPQMAELLLSQARIFSLMKKLKDANSAYQQSILITDNLLKSTLDIQRPDIDEYVCFLDKTYQFDGKADDFEYKRNQMNGNPYLQKGVINGKALKIISPELPPRKRTGFGSLKIFVRVVTGEDGSVINARTFCSGNALYHEASLKAAYKSKFAPTLKDGVPIKGIGLIIYNIPL